MQYDDRRCGGFAILRKVQMMAVAGVEHLLIKGAGGHALFFEVGDKMLPLHAHRYMDGVRIAGEENAANMRENCGLA